MQEKLPATSETCEAIVGGEYRRLAPECQATAPFPEERAAKRILSSCICERRAVSTLGHIRGLYSYAVLEYVGGRADTPRNIRRKINQWTRCSPYQ